MRIRTVREEEPPLLREIERAAGACFRDVGMPEIADDEPLPVEVLAAHRRNGIAWVAADEADRPVAYLVAEVPWNTPYHERCGFRLLDGTTLTPGLREIRRGEAAYGLDRRPRVCMRRDL